MAQASETNILPSYKRKIPGSDVIQFNVRTDIPVPAGTCVPSQKGLSTRNYMVTYGRCPTCEELTTGIHQVFNYNDFMVCESCIQKVRTAGEANLPKYVLNY